MGTKALEEIISEAEQEEASAHKWGRYDHWIHLCVGALAVVAGVLAGISGVGDWQRAITVVAGFAAAALTGFQTLAQAEGRSRLHYQKRADFGNVALKGRILADQTSPPSDDELSALADQLTEVRARIFQDVAKD
jgi:hypothetical protein